MKKLFLFIASGLLLFSCKTESKPDYVIVSGKIENAKTQEITLRDLEGNLKKTFNLDNEGSFKDTLEIEESGFYALNNLPRIYLEKGDDLQMNIDAENPYESPVFKGIGSIFNQYMIDASNKHREIEGKDFEAFYGLERRDFTDKLDEIKLAQLTLLDSAETLNENLRAKEQRNIHYNYLMILSQYKMLHGRIAGHDEDIDISREFENFNYNSEEDYEFSQMYMRLVSSYYRDRVNETVKQDSLTEHEALFVVMEKIPNEKIRNSLLFGRAHLNIPYVDNLEEYYGRFIEISTDSIHRDKITEAYNNLKRLANGMPSPDFLDYENHAGGTTSLKDLGGKYLYIDVWATWCKPCLEEIPALKELEEKYANKNIEFVSISTDLPRAYEKWKNMVSEKDLGGVQLLADKAFDSDFIKEYEITAIPRFMIIDPNGNIVSRLAHAPSNPDLEEQLGSLEL